MVGIPSCAHVCTQQGCEAPPALGTAPGAPGRGAGEAGGGGSEAARVWGAAAQAVEAAETCASGVLWLELERVHLVGPRALRLKAEAMSLQ